MKIQLLKLVRQICSTGPRKSMIIEGKRNRSVTRKGPWNSIFLYIFFAFYMGQSLFYCAVSFTVPKLHHPVCSQSRPIGSRNRNGKSDRRRRNPSFSSHFTLALTYVEQSTIIVQFEEKNQTQNLKNHSWRIIFVLKYLHQIVYIFLFTLKFKNTRENDVK